MYSTCTVRVNVAYMYMDTMREGEVGRKWQYGYRTHIVKVTESNREGVRKRVIVCI